MESKYKLEVYSSTFNWVVEYLKREIQSAKDRNCADLSEVETAKTRGRIQANQQLLKEFEALLPKTVSNV